MHSVMVELEHVSWELEFMMAVALEKKFKEKFDIDKTRFWPYSAM